MYKGEPQICEKEIKRRKRGGGNERKKEKRGENNQTLNSLLKYKHFFNLGVGQFFFESDDNDFYAQKRIYIDKL